MKHLYGITAAMTTPFYEEGDIDIPSLKNLTDFLITSGVNCLYPCGTTGEMLRLTPKERKKIAETVVDTSAGKTTVFIHCGAMTMNETVDLLCHAKSAGADGAGIVTPQFFHASSEELYHYYVSLAGRTPDFPIYIYNIPQCAANDILPETIERICKDAPNIIGIKYSYADLDRTISYLGINDRRFSVLHGYDKALSALLMLGCNGTVSGVAGVFPEPFVKVYESYLKNDIPGMKYWQKICIRFCDILKCGKNMSYFKEALKLRGIMQGFMRLPQLSIEIGEISRLKQELEELCRTAHIPLRY